MQDDGSHSTRFAPYFANSGFYFLRQTPRTRYFMTMLLYGADTILEWSSHQSALDQARPPAPPKFPKETEEKHKRRRTEASVCSFAGPSLAGIPMRATRGPQF